MAKHAKNTTAQAIARTGARTTAALAVTAAGLLAVSGVANAGSGPPKKPAPDSGSMIQNTEVDGAGGGGGGDQGNSADGLVPILNNNDVNVQANVCDVLNNLNVDIVEIASELNIPILNEIEGGVGRTNVGDTNCGNSSEQNDTNTSADSDDTVIVG